MAPYAREAEKIWYRFLNPFLAQKSYHAIIRGILKIQIKRPFSVRIYKLDIGATDAKTQSERLALSSIPTEEVLWRMKEPGNKVRCFSWSGPIWSLSSLRCMEKEPLSCQLLALWPGRDIKRGKARSAQKRKWLKAAARAEETKVLAGDADNGDACASMANAVAMA